LVTREERDERREIRDRDLLAFDDGIRLEHRTFLVAGVDEVGRGPLAGPVVAAAVILPPGTLIPGADDSKALTPEKREELYRDIVRLALAWSWGLVQPRTIDRINILEASRLAMRRALAGLDPRPETVVVDGWSVPRLRFAQVALPGADATSLSVACASILAKVRRDRIMTRCSRKFPEYDFKSNKGYGTPAHLEVLDRVGPCPLHRKSFMPVAQMRLPLTSVCSEPDIA
jgi:ribonuclease HII